MLGSILIVLLDDLAFYVPRHKGDVSSEYLFISLSRASTCFQNIQTAKKDNFISTEQYNSDISYVTGHE